MMVFCFVIGAFVQNFEFFEEVDIGGKSLQVGKGQTKLIIVVIDDRIML